MIEEDFRKNIRRYNREIQRGDKMAYNPLAFGQMLVAMGSLVFAAFLYTIYRGTLDARQSKSYGGVFMLLGIIASTFGLGLFMSEPIPGHYIEVYGVGYLVFTMLMLIAGLCLIFDWDYRPASYLAFVGGLALLHSAYAIWTNQMSKSPAVTATIFLLSGIGAAGSIYMTHGDLQKKRTWILLGITIFVIFGAMALFSGMMAQAGHIQSALA